MRVEHTQTPSRHHQEANPREHDPDQIDRDGPTGALEPGRQCGDEDRRANHANGDHDRHDTGEQPGGRPGKAAGVVRPALRPKAGVLGDEGRRQRAFAKEILEEIGNPERRGERVSRRGCLTEVVSQDPLPDQPEDPAREDTGRDPGRAPARGPAAHPRPLNQCAI